MIAETIASGIQPLQNLAVLLQLDEDKRSAWGNGCIDRGFQGSGPLRFVHAAYFLVIRT